MVNNIRALGMILTGHVNAGHELQHRETPYDSSVFSFATPIHISKVHYRRERDMSYSSRPLSSNLRNPSASLGGSQTTGQSPVLIARIAEKKAELANLKELQALSAGLSDQMQALADKLSTLSDGTEGMFATDFQSLHCETWRGK
jgi:hypothetical protein